MRGRATVPLACVLISGCALNPPPVPTERAPVPTTELTAGRVQKDLRAGLSGADVLAAVGSPNLVTRDAEGHEVWVYDRVSTERTETAASAWGGVLAGGTAVPITGVAAAGGSQGRKTETTHQSTLTVVVRFDADARVASVSMHASRF